MCCFGNIFSDWTLCSCETSHEKLLEKHRFNQAENELLKNVFLEGKHLLHSTVFFFLLGIEDVVGSVQWCSSVKTAYKLLKNVKNGISTGSSKSTSGTKIRDSSGHLYTCVIHSNQKVEATPVSIHKGRAEQSIHEKWDSALALSIRKQGHSDHWGEARRCSAHKHSHCANKTSLAEFLGNA